MFLQRKALLFTLCLVSSSLQLEKIVTEEHSAQKSSTSSQFVYQGYVSLGLQGEESIAAAKFFASIAPKQGGCSKSSCFLGWIHNYTQVGSEHTKVGFVTGQSSEGDQPVFELRSDSETDYEIIRSPVLSQDWVGLIQLFCHKINPQLLKESACFPGDDQIKDSKYRFQKADPNAKPTTSGFLPMDVNSNDFIYNSTQGVELSQVEMTHSEAEEVMILDKDKNIKHRRTVYNFSLSTQNLKTDSTDSTGNQKEEIPNTVLAEIKLHVISNLRKSTENDVNQIVSSFNGSEHVFVHQDTKSNSPINSDANQQISGYRKEDSKVTKNNVASLGVNVGQAMRNPQLSKTSTNLRKYKTENKHQPRPRKPFSPSPKRLLQQSSNVIYNQSESLLSHKVLGHTFSVTLDPYCTLNVEGDNHTVQCIAEIIPAWGPASYPFQVYQFETSVSKSWDWSKHFSHNLSDSFQIPMPDPISFMTIDFKFTIVANLDLGLNAEAYLTESGMNFEVKPSVSAEVSIDADVSLSVVVAEGGIKADGTLVKVTTNPDFSLQYNFYQNSILCSFDWAATLDSAEVSLAFYLAVSFWRFHSSRTLKSWKVYGGYAHTWTIYNGSKAIDV